MMVHKENHVSKRLAGKRAVVSGGAGGIGSAICYRYAQAGAQVMMVDVDVRHGTQTAQQLCDAGYDVSFAEGDVTRGSDMAAIAAEIKQSWGSLDILAHVAGISGRPLGDGPVTECSEETWRRVIDVNLTGAYMVCHHLVPLMYETGGSVIHIASDDALAIPPPPHDTHAYIAAKGGLIALTKAMAISYAPRKIRTNAIAPGWIESPMTLDLTTVSSTQQALIDRHPLGRLGRPDDIAWAAVFLASDESDFITGAVLPVEGGATVW